jgi:hypothetical protein
MQDGILHPVRQDPLPNGAEQLLRERLGIPLDASSVIVFGETSHWDPNWIFTSEEYYHNRVQHILDEVIEALAHHPRRVFSLESLFFCQLYWERRPERRETFRRLVNEGRIRFTGTGITTPDTLLPSTESILRDYLYGQEWLRTSGMSAEPRLAYLPDGFGHTPFLPSLLRSMGYEQAAVTRIDGMYFVGADYRKKSAFPLRGSSADLLLRQLKTLDFVWRAPDGAEVLCHWNAFTYFQADMLAHVGAIRWMGRAYGVPWRSERHVARRIRGYVRKLSPLTRTPYMFCPLGCDFNGPLPQLLELLERHNSVRYVRTGVFAVNASLEDYLDLVSCHAGRLPSLELDPNPYWMGFYVSRPAAKVLYRKLERKLALADQLMAVASLNGVSEQPPIEEPQAAATTTVASGTPPPSAETRRHLRKAWDILVVSNHHDFITGTAPDRVWHAEQRPWLEEANGLVDGVLHNLGAEARPAGHPPPLQPPWWRFAAGRLEVRSPYYRLILSEEAGGCIVHLATARDGETSLLAAPGNDLVAYRDSGGLWRMGHEYAGGTFRELCRSSERPASVVAQERDGVLEVRVRSRLAGRPFVRWLWLRGDSPFIGLRIQGSADLRRAIACRFPTVYHTESLVMDVPGGVVCRPAQKLYTPTYWPARSFAHAVDAESGRGFGVIWQDIACVALRDTGLVEWVALRNAPREMAYGILPLLAHPATGTDHDEHTIDYGVVFTEGGDSRVNDLPRQARAVLCRAWRRPGAPDPAARMSSVFCTDQPEVEVSAFKEADRGPGIIVRLESHAEGETRVRLSCGVRPIRAALLCDARERDQRELTVDGGEVEVPVARATTSVRVLY